MLEKQKNKVYKLLRWTEKWTKTDMIYLTKGGFWLSAGQAVTMFSAFLLSLAFANLLPAEIYGEYRYILSLSSFLTIPTLGGMQTAIVRGAAKGYEGVLNKGMIISMKWGLLGGLASLFFSLYYYLNGNNNLTISFLFIAIFTPFVGPLNSFYSFLLGKKLFKLSTKLNIIRELFLLITTFLSLLITKNVIILIFIYFASRTIIRFIFLQITLHITKPNNKIDKNLLTLGKHFSVIGILETVAGQIDKILIWHYLGAVQLAVYGFAMAPVNQLKGALVKNLASMAMPKIAENSISNVKRTFPNKIFKMLMLTGLISIIYIYFSPFFFNTFFPQYVDSIFYSRLFTISLFIIPFSLFNVAIIAHGGKKPIYILSIAGNILKISLFFILLPLYGITGGIMSLIIVDLWNSTLMGYLFYRL